MEIISPRVISSTLSIPSTTVVAVVVGYKIISINNSRRRSLLECRTLDNQRFIGSDIFIDRSCGFVCSKYTTDCYDQYYYYLCTVHTIPLLNRDILQVIRLEIEP